MNEINVAIADDNERILDLLGDMIDADKELKLVGKANNGEDAYEMIRQKQPDVVLLDLILPKMDGLSVMDQVNNDQREIIYKERLRVLNGESMRDAIFKMITDRVESCVDTCISSEIPKDEWDLNELNQLLLPIIPLEPITEETIADIRNNKELKHLLKEKAVKLYEAKETEFPEPEQFRELERVVLLKVIDQKWMDHIDDMDQLRQGIGLQAYGQRDPLVEYKMAGFDMFDEMIAGIQEDTIRLLYHVQVEQKVEREQVAKVTGTNKDESAAKAPKKREHAKVYPNDPCPCGSGKKYKQCCGRKVV